MTGTVLYGPRDVRSEDRPEPKMTQPTDAILRLSATCICGSDLWPYRGIAEIKQPTLMGHEYCGIVEEVGKEVQNIKPGQFVVGSFATSDNTCLICRALCLFLPFQTLLYLHSRYDRIDRIDQAL